MVWGTCEKRGSYEAKRTSRCMRGGDGRAPNLEQFLDILHLLANEGNDLERGEALEVLQSFVVHLSVALVQKRCKSCDRIEIQGRLVGAPLGLACDGRGGRA